MDEKVARIIQGIRTLDDLAQFEANAGQRNALTDEMKEAIKKRSADLGRPLIAERTGLDLENLTPAEEKIVLAVSEYVGVMKRQGKDATRTFEQLSNRGLLDAAETAVAKSKPTLDYERLVDADRKELSYEQIVVDHPDEFSPRALWYSRRTLGLPNYSAKPPAKGTTPIQTKTETLLRWLEERSATNDGLIPPFTNSEAAVVIGKRYGDVDVLAWQAKTGRILLIECKDLHFGKTFGEIAEQLADFRGELRANGKPDDLRRHLDRIDVLRAHAAALTAFVHLDPDAAIEGHLVFKNPVPMQFSAVRLNERIRLHVFDGLTVL